MWQPVFVTTDERDAELGRIRLVDVRRPAAAAVQLADSEDPLVLIGHASTASRLTVLATYVAANQPGRLVAHGVTHHAPLAAAAALDQAASLARDAGHAVSAWRDVLEHTWSAAVLSSVTRLSRPNPTMSQHLRSWWPSSRFVVRQGDDPRSVPAARVDELIADLPRRGLEAFVTAGSDDEVVRHVVSAVAPTGLRTVEGLAGWPGVYGLSEQLQLALLPADVALHVRAPAAPCDTCGLHAADPVCPFCRTRTRPSGTGPTSPTSPPQPVGDPS
ncbi:hypothetical protein [Jannaschia sp. R86511]|uniref:hypothetical protein n=1 Tax=Jannaschia sp. R86511 TaxID=3093853 RepID=UPI0036D42DA8